MKTTIAEIAAVGMFVLAACEEVRNDPESADDATTGDVPDDDESPPADDDDEGSSTAADSSEADSSAEDDDGSSTTGDPMTVCVGWSLDGHIADVHAREGTRAPAECDPTPAPCGGDPTGTWTLLASCGQSPPDLFPCESATEHDYTATTTGTRTFAADGTFAWDLVMVETVAVELDSMACYRMDCTSFAASLQTAISTATCESVDDTTCACTVEYTSPLVLDGTWTTDGDALALEVAGIVVEQPFCTSGDSLTLWSPSETSTLTDVPCTTADDCTAALGDDYAHYDCIEPPDTPGG